MARQIFQGVTLGEREVDVFYHESLCPTLGNGVMIDSGAEVLGGLTLGSARVAAPRL